MNPSDIRDINKAYISPYDLFLKEFDKTHKPSVAQKKEIAKHKRIATLRDNPTPNSADLVIWDEF